MTTQLDAVITVQGQGSLQDIGELIYTPLESFIFGSGGWDALTVTFADGVGPSQANDMYIAQREVDSGDTDTLDLSNLTGGLGVNATISFQAVKAVVIQVVSPDGNKVLHVGLNGTSEAALLWNGPNSNIDGVFEEVWDWMVHLNRWDGWPIVNGDSHLLPISNPQTEPVTYNVLIIGIRS